jgi:hypothetical protein
MGCFRCGFRRGFLFRRFRCAFLGLKTNFLFILGHLARMMLIDAVYVVQRRKRRDGTNMRQGEEEEKETNDGSRRNVLVNE